MKLGPCTLGWRSSRRALLGALRQRTLRGSEGRAVRGCGGAAAAEATQGTQVGSRSELKALWARQLSDNPSRATALAGQADSRECW